MENNTTPGAMPQPLLIFVMGAPCSGKSTLCHALSSNYILEHFSLSGELRDLVSATPTSRAALIKRTLSPEEIDTFTYCLSENMLAPPELTSKYINERLFGAGAAAGQVRVLVDGFPRDLDRWERFKEMAKDVFKPNENTFLIVLHITAEAAWARYELRARPGDDFEGRFEQYERNEREVSDAMVEDGVLCLDVGVGEPTDPDPFEVVAEFLAERMDEWAASY